MFESEALFGLVLLFGNAEIFSLHTVSQFQIS